MTAKEVNSLATDIAELVYRAGSAFERHGYDHRAMDDLASRLQLEVVTRLAPYADSPDEP